MISGSIPRLGQAVAKKAGRTKLLRHAGPRQAVSHHAEPSPAGGARAMLGETQADLADIAAIGRRTLVDFERDARVPYPNNLEAIRAALEAAGIEFLPNNG